MPALGGGRPPGGVGAGPGRVQVVRRGLGEVAAVYHSHEAYMYRIVTEEEVTMANSTRGR